MTLLQSGLAKSLAEDYTIDNSLLCNDGDEPFLYENIGQAPTSDLIWTLSFWCKLGTFGSYRRVGACKYTSGMGAGTAAINLEMGFMDDDVFEFRYFDDTDTGYGIETEAVFRDPSAWYHFTLVFNVPDSTAADRMQIWVNGVRQTVTTSGSGYPPDDKSCGYTSNAFTRFVGGSVANPTTPTVQYPFDGYLAEVYLMDGTAYTASDFGELNATTNQWIPKDASGLTFGTNGFYQKYGSTELATSFADSAESYITEFTSTGTTTWTAPAGVTSVDYLVVAGGGAGGGDMGGGGGGGGVKSGTSFSVTPGASYTVTVGAGGAGASHDGSNGGDSVFSSITSTGGGKGGAADGGTEDGSDGGSGGGACGGGGTGGSGTGSEGNDGGDGQGQASDFLSGGGGGAGTVGGDYVDDDHAGNGGNGIQNDIDGNNYYYGAGGGGSSYNVSGIDAGTGGLGGGGGGNGGHASTGGAGGTGGRNDGGAGPSGGGDGGDAGANTGSGGGGCGTRGSNVGGDGGSGIVIIKHTQAGVAPRHTITANGDVTNTRAVRKVGDSSIKFDGTGDYLTIPNSSDWDMGTGSFTVECWVRFDAVGDVDTIIERDFATNQRALYIAKQADNTINAQTGSGTGSISSIDSSSTVAAETWYHIAYVRDGTDFELFIDGTSVGTDTDAATMFDSDEKLAIGMHLEGGTTSDPFKGYIDEIRISNTARYTSAFTPQTTEFTADANTKLLIHSNWTGGLGADSSGNYNTFTPTNIVATDQVPDTPTRNWCTMNPLTHFGGGAIFNGNLGVSGGNNTMSTFSPTSGKWYWEIYIHAVVSTGNHLGIISTNFAKDEAHYNEFDLIGFRSDAFDQSTAGRGQGITAMGSNTATLATFTDGDIMSFELNLDTPQVIINKNDSPVMNRTFTYDNSFPVLPWLRNNTSNVSIVNFGQDSSFAGNKTAQGNQDDNGIGDFYYDVPAGFLALCKDNLSAPEIALPGENFNTVLYNGNSQVAQSITGVGFEPDLVWIKRRNYAGGNHVVFDQVRGVNKELQVNADGAEGTRTGSLNSFDSDGWTTSTDNGTNVNLGTYTYVNWNWKAGGAPTADNSAGAGATPTAGSVKIDGANLGSALAGSVQVDRLSANTTAGFSIVKFPGDGSVETVGHGLSQAPEFITFKGMGDTSNWPVYHKDLDGGTDPEDYYVYLNHSSAESASAAFWNDTAPTASVFTIGSTGSPAADTPYIAYCFHSVEGYSKVGSYAGNSSSTNGTFVYCGFKPAYVLNKMIEPHTYGWVVEDSVRDPYNAAGYQLYPDTNGVEGVNHPRLDFISNGFKWYDASYDVNHSTSTYLFIAFAESPFKYSNAR